MRGLSFVLSVLAILALALSQAAPPLAGADPARQERLAVASAPAPHIIKQAEDVAVSARGKDETRPAVTFDGGALVGSAEFPLPIQPAVCLRSQGRAAGAGPSRVIAYDACGPPGMVPIAA